MSSFKYSNILYSINNIDLSSLRIGGEVDRWTGHTHLGVVWGEN
jgi:hypothetical protein